MFFRCVWEMEQDFCDMLTDRSKELMKQCCFLGQTTDTQDTTGTVLTENREKALELDEEKVRQVILGFKGRLRSDSAYVFRFKKSMEKAL